MIEKNGIFRGVSRLRTLSAQRSEPFSMGFGAMGLGVEGVHEVCERAYGHRGALTGFALAALGPRYGEASCRKVVLWITQSRFVHDQGRPVHPSVLAIRPGLQILHAEVARADQGLWAAEEAIRSGVPGLVMAEVDGADFTATRRLMLASARHGVPAVLLLPHTCHGATASAARWRVGPRPSAPNPFDPRAPGPVRWRAVLERCRLAPERMGQVFELEYDEETLSLDLVSGLAVDAPVAGEGYQPNPAGAGRRYG